MRTVRCSSRLLGAGGVCPEGDVCLPPPWTELQTLVKTLPCRNYVADGKNSIVSALKERVLWAKNFFSTLQLRKNITRFILCSHRYTYDSNSLFHIFDMSN